jgi:hypothetical protein
MLAGGLIPALDAVHGEPVSIITGATKGQSFRAVIEVEQDIQVGQDFGVNPRGKRVCRIIGTVPGFGSQDEVQTQDGRKWTLVKESFSGYLTNDYEMVEVTSRG